MTTTLTSNLLRAPRVFGFKPSPTNRAALIASAALVLLSTLSGCAGLDSAAAPELQVRKLATQRWQALLAKDFDKAYEFAAPSYRQIRSAEYYSDKRRITPVKWLAVEVLRVECEATKCITRIKLESKPLTAFQFSGTLITAMDETWVFEGGQWWMFETL